jgi:hypothetical protein
MPEIMIRCPTLGTAVKTGLCTETVVLDSLERTVPIPMLCPACMKLHKWQRKDAWVDTANGHDSLPRGEPSLAGFTERKRALTPLWFWHDF